MRTFFLLGYGLLPIWVALILVAYGYMTMQPEHAGMILWALIPAITACGATLLVAGAALAIHSRVAGSSQRKLQLSGTFVIATSLALSAGVVALWLVRQGNAEDLRAEQAHVQDFVMNSAEVRAAAGQQLKVSIASYSVAQSGSMPVAYEVSVAGSKQVFAIVEVNRKSSPVQFRLKCTTPLSGGQRNSHQDPCTQ